MKRIFLNIAMAILALPAQVFAWGHDGHRIIGEIAMQYLNATTKENVQAVLGHTSVDEAANWMDAVRSNSYYDYQKHWHYIDIPKGSTYVKGQGDNLIAALNQSFSDLKNGKLHGREEKEAVMIIFHLLGDMHQPLHTGYPEDKGGNTVQVNFEGGGTNLHHVWDDDILESEKITTETCMALGSRLTAGEIKVICAGNFVDWMNSSRAHLPEVYDFTGSKLGSDYADKNKMLVERQLLIGGIRLACVLKTLFDKPSMKAELMVAGASVSQHPVVAPKATDITCTPDEAAKHIGEVVTVCGKVYGIKTLEKSSGPTFINIGTAYPNSPFTAVIFPSDRNNFSYKPEDKLDGHEICVTGTVKEYKGKTEIVVVKEEQIKIK